MYLDLRASHPKTWCMHVIFMRKHMTEIKYKLAMGEFFSSWSLELKGSCIGFACRKSYNGCTCVKTIWNSYHQRPRVQNAQERAHQAGAPQISLEPEGCKPYNKMASTAKVFPSDSAEVTTLALLLGLHTLLEMRKT